MASKPALEPEEPARPRRRRSKLLPPNLEELMHQLIAAAASFIQMFGSSETRMREIVEEFMKIAEEVKALQRTTDNVRTIGAVAGVLAGVGVVAAVFAAPFTGGLSLLAAHPLAAAAVGSGGGVITVAYANVTKLLSEKGKAKEVENLGKDFILLIEPLKEKLEGIKTTCENLEEESSKVQAENTLRDVDEFQEILRRVKELKARSGGVLIESVTLLNVMKETVLLLVNIFRITATPEEDNKLRDSIIQSADQGQKVVDEFTEMTKKLREFRKD